MKEITIDQLPQYSTWPLRLLRLEDFQQKTRTAVEVLREYDQDKWSAVLRYLKSTTNTSSDDILAAQGLDPNSECVFMRDDRYFVTCASEIMREYNELLVRETQPCMQNVLVELGCGIGNKLIHLLKVYNPIHVMGINTQTAWLV